MGSKKVFIRGMGWCYQVTSELENKIEKNVTGDKTVRILNQKQK